MVDVSSVLEREELPGSPHSSRPWTAGASEPAAGRFSILSKMIIAPRVRRDSAAGIADRDADERPGRRLMAGRALRVDLATFQRQRRQARAACPGAVGKIQRVIDPCTADAHARQADRPGIDRGWESEQQMAQEGGAEHRAV